MKLFNFKKKRDDSRSRRNTRLWIQRARDLSLSATVLVAIGMLGFAGYHNGAFKKANSWIVTQALTKTAAAGFKVKDILVTGRAQIPADVLLSHLSIKQDMPIFGVSIADAQKSLSDIPWIKDVSISRRLPDKIIVELTERAPVALWQFQKKISVIDQEGAVLTTENLESYQQLPLVVGAEAPKHVSQLVSLLNAEPELADTLTSAVRVGAGRWDLHLKNGITVKLPEQDVELALRRLALAQEQKKIFSRNIVSIDLRHPQKMVVLPAKQEEPTDKKNKKTTI